MKLTEAQWTTLEAMANGGVWTESQLGTPTARRLREVGLVARVDPWQFAGDPEVRITNAGRLELAKRSKP